MNQNFLGTIPSARRNVFLGSPLVAAGILVLACSWGAAQPALVLLPPPGVADKAKHVVLLSGDEEYRSEEALPMLAKILSQRHGFKCTVLFALDPDGTINPDNVRSLPGAEALDSADVIIMALRFRDWPDDQMRHFVEAYRRGVPIIGLRTSTHPFRFTEGAYRDFNDFGKRVLGEGWVSHWGRHKVQATRTVIEPGADRHPLLRGVGEIFGDTDVYEAYPPADATILLRGMVLQGMNPADPPADHVKSRRTDQIEQPVNDPMMAVAWTRVHRNEAGRENRILCTTLGAATDLQSEGLRRLIVNGVHWALDLPVPQRADVRYVDPYHPTMYGFRTFRRGLRPADHAVGTVLPEGQAAPPRPAPAAPRAPNAGLLLRPGEHIAIIGNALADRMQHHGWLETMVHQIHPEHRLVFRNLAVAGDEVVTRARSMGFGTPDEWLARVGANVVFAFFGFNESFRGPGGLPQFKQDLDAFLRQTRAGDFGGAGPPRIVLFSPIANERHPDPNFSLPPENNANLKLYTAAMAEVARGREGVVFVDLFSPTERLFAEAQRDRRPFTFNGVHLTEEGEAKVAAMIFSALFAEDPPQAVRAELRSAVNEKNAVWHARYRAVDGYNVHGGRSQLVFPAGSEGAMISNYEVMQQEMAQREVLTAALEGRIWAIAKGEAVGLSQVELPPVSHVPTNRPGIHPDGSHAFLSGEEAIAKMNLHPGLKVNLFASEERFPELVNPVQMAWDTRGRLWVAVWPNYPNLSPTAESGDRLLVFEDTNGDGRADTCTTFLDGLNAPTGFQFYKDGVLLVQAPDLWFVRDTNGDGRADWKERVLMGLDSADTHHTSNSLALDPGGAIYLSDGVFHRTQVETTAGAVRNIDGGIYRFEPNTGRFEIYSAFDWVNPHGRTFDRWGNALFTDATGNRTYFAAAISGRLDYPEKHPALKEFWTRPARPSAGSRIITTRHFPDEFQGNFLNGNVIGFLGFYRVKVEDDGAGLKGERLADFLSSSDPNFRPVDVSVGPDGAVYVLDWHNPIIGHMQHHLRDPNRDNVHGRIYRVTYEGRPLLSPPKIYGEPVPALLELLREPENHVREWAKIELGKHDAKAVCAAVRAWVSRLDPSDPDHEHHLTEALWVHQWHNTVDEALLKRVLRSPDPRARAAATRVLSYWADRVPDALALLKVQAADEHPRVRLHAVRAASFFRTEQAVEIPLAALMQPLDYYLEYTLRATIRQLRPHWRDALGPQGAVGAAGPAEAGFFLSALSAADLLNLPQTPAVLDEILRHVDVTEPARAAALAELARQRGASPLDALLEYLEMGPGRAPPGLGKLLVAQPPAELTAARPRIAALAGEAPETARRYAWAARVMADGSIEAAWDEAVRSAGKLTDLLLGIAVLPDLSLRASAYDRVAALADGIGLPSGISAGEAGAVQRAAILAAVSTQQDTDRQFRSLTQLLRRGEQVPTVARALRELPRASWSRTEAAPAVAALIEWAAGLPASDRRSREYAETIATADVLMAGLPPEQAGPLSRQLRSLRGNVFVIRAVRGEMRFDRTRIVLEPGQAVQIVLENPDVMPHNLVIVKPGARERVGQAAMLLAPDRLDANGRAYVPDSSDVIVATRLLDAGESETLRFVAPAIEGVYEYVCTYPGHWMVMWGELVVTREPEAQALVLPGTQRELVGAGHRHPR